MQANIKHYRFVFKFHSKTKLEWREKDEKEKKTFGRVGTIFFFSSL